MSTNTMVHPKRKRTVLGETSPAVLEVPNLIEVQLNSFEEFLQVECIRKNKKPQSIGFEAMLQSFFPITRSDGNISLEYDSYVLDFEQIRYTEQECRKFGHSYTIPVRLKVNLVFHESGEIRQKEVYIGDFPLMTRRGTFIFNGAERVVVSQIQRSPGVAFSVEDSKYSARLIPAIGKWIEFDIDAKTGMIVVKIDRKKKILATSFLRAIGYVWTEDIVEQFYKIKTIELNKDSAESQKVVSELSGEYLARELTIEGSKEHLTFLCGQKLHPQDVSDLLASSIVSIDVVDLEHPDSLHSECILTTLDHEIVACEKRGLELTQDNLKKIAIDSVIVALSQGKVGSIEDGEQVIQSTLFSLSRYDLTEVGRYKLNQRFGYSENPSERTLLPIDIVNTMKHLIGISIGELVIDDIDHLSNRRIRMVGEMLCDHIKGAFYRLERIAKDRMGTKELETLRPQDVISIKPIMNALNEFFGLSQLSQFMDQINPLAALTHKRRLNALGPGGLTRDRAKFEVRDVHYTHYGRMCPIETPEGPNIGLIISLATYARVNQYGFLEAPYRKIKDGKVTNTIKYLSAKEEEQCYIAQADASVKDDGTIVKKNVEVRKAGHYTTRPVEEVEYMDVSPRQIISVSASLIPFLEHDDANRALMGSNMQRQAVPLLFPTAPRVGTGFEQKAAYDSGASVISEFKGVATYVSNDKIVIESSSQKTKSTNEVTYDLIKYQRSNQDTCIHQRPMIDVGDSVQAGQVIASGASIDSGELALGQNVLVGFMSWHGYNYEDAILISERVVRDDVFTSIHIKEFKVDVRETKLGPEKLTRDIPNTSADALNNLDEFGIVRVGTYVTSSSILVGKVTPKSEMESSPEFKLLNSIFGEKAREVRDTSLRLPHGTQGVVVDIQHLTRDIVTDLQPGVVEVVKVTVATKRKLKEGDKMAGRHGNKGVIARILPIEDMPYLEDGTPLDVCLSPLGLPSRMNLGQILETQLGWAAATLDEWYSSFVFESATEKEIQKKLKDAKLPINSKATVYDGLTGEAFQNPITVGVTYLLKLHHLVDDKMHARSIGPYSLVTQQPLGGKAQFGGQRLGEMEVWALEAYGAANTLQELLTIKSDDMQGRTKIYENIVKSEPLTSPGIPESFNVLVNELRGLGLDLKIYDNKQRQIPLVERDEEMIAREGSDF